MAAVKSIMRANNNTRQYNQQDHNTPGGRIKGFLSRPRSIDSVDTQTDQQQQQQQLGTGSMPSSTYTAQPHLNAAMPVVDDLLPNPKIPDDSPTGTPPKKIWEGAYRHFLSRGKNNSSPSLLTMVEPPSPPPPPRMIIDAPPASPPNKKSPFSVIAGSKRLVSRALPRTPQSVPDLGRMVTEIDKTNVPSMPALHVASSRGMSDGNLKRHGGEANSTATATGTATGSMGSTSAENTVRGGKFFQAIFNRTTSFRRRSPSHDSHDELDAPLRKGIEKSSSSPDYHRAMHTRKRAPSHGEETTTEEDDDGLDSLLASASSSPSYVTMSMGMPMRVSSLGSFHQHPLTSSAVENSRSITEHKRSVSMHQFLIPPQIPHIIPPQIPQIIPPQIIMEPENDRAPIQFPQPRQTTRPQGHLGSLLAQQVSNYDELDAQHHHHRQQNAPSEHDSQNEYTPPQHQQQQPESATSKLEEMLQDPSFAVQTSPSASSLLYAINPEMKKAFTEFHNASRFARDATSPFLGDDSSSLRRDSYVSYHPMMMGGGGSSVPHHAYSERNTPVPVNVSTSLPLDAVDEYNLSIHRGMRLLRPVEATETWQQGRRYLIAPAALASCPLTVVNKLTGSLVQNAVEAATSESPQGFGRIDLGEALITYVGEFHHLSLGKWSSCRLVLQQNMLLEYASSTPDTGLPRGFAHLEHAIAFKHNDFQDAFELQFYASPCSKSDQRVLMVRVRNREERDHWVTCLNNAAKLRMEDLWEFDPEFEFGRGRYASVYPARRKNDEYFAKQGLEKIGEGKPDRTELLKRCDCALKVVDKNEFWRRVVKGRERADTLVREQSVQSTLTAKCGRVPTFLKLRGFFETSDNIVMELELLEGTDLFGYVSSKGVLGEDEAALIIRDVLTSLQAMNRVGLAHRDVKPANVLMCCREKDGVSVKVGDFGMSTFVGVDGLIRGRCGTPGYVAPEILSAGSRAGYGNKVDVFSAGVTLYVMLCGYEPFYGETDKELIEANKRAVIDFPESDWGEVSKEARDLVLKMTMADPRDRISAKEALQHPWITRMGSNDAMGVSSPNSKITALAASDAPEEGACVIS